MRDHIPALDGLRGIAAWLVVLAHTNQALASPMISLADGGQSGVMIFFALSGFLMGFLYSNRDLDQVGNYAVARVARVFPLYLIVVVYSFLSQEGVLNLPLYSFRVTTENLISHLLFVRGRHVLWTIPVEVTFYVLFVGLWAIRSHTRTAYLACLALLFAAPLIFGIIQLPTGHRLPYYIPYFIIGLLTAELYMRRSAELTGTLSVVSLLTVFLSIWFLIPGNYRLLTGVSIGGYQSAMPLVLTALVLVGALYSAACQTFFGSWVFALQGRISYSIYLLHVIVVKSTVMHTGLDDWRLFAVVIPLTFVVSMLSFNYLEKPCGRLIKAGYKRYLDRRAAAT